MYKLGIDLGGTNIVAGVVNDGYEIISKASCKTNLPRPAEEICDSMAQVALEALSQAGLTLEDVSSVGIGVPGAVNPVKGTVVYSANLLFRNCSIADLMKERLNCKVVIENDANAAAYGEFLAGSAKGSVNAVAITLGTGVGGGLILNGKIFGGSDFGGAELGHVVIEKGGRQCGCGRKGCWEAYSSATGLINMTKDAIRAEDPEKSYMLKAIGGDINKVSGRTAFDAMRAGDPTAAAVVDEYIDYLACGVANMLNIFQPDVLCIGGGVSKEGDYLIKPLNEKIKQEIYTKDGVFETKICAATLGNDAGVIGAAFLENLY